MLGLPEPELHRVASYSLVLSWFYTWHSRNWGIPMAGETPGVNDATDIT